MRAVLTLMLSLCGASVAAQEIYKWVDGAGQVHYGERPPHGAAAKHLPTHAAALSAGPAEDVDRLEQQRKLLQSFEEDRAKREEKAAEVAKEAEARKKNCMVARDDLRSMQEAALVYELDDQGERRILNDAERDSVEHKARSQVEEWCK